MDSSSSQCSAQRAASPLAPVLYSIYPEEDREAWHKHRSLGGQSLDPSAQGTHWSTQPTLGSLNCGPGQVLWFCLPGTQPVGSVQVLLCHLLSLCPQQAASSSSPRLKRCHRRPEMQMCWNEAQAESSFAHRADGMGSPGLTTLCPPASSLPTNPQC